jgi:hypothetical protein
VNRPTFVARLHELLAPPAYLAIGAGQDESLAVAPGRAVGVDPAYEPTAGVKLYRETCDEYFARVRPLAALGGRRVALASLTGVHPSEAALRALANVERSAEWTSAIVLDGVLPRSVKEAARDRRTSAAPGDVYKLLDVLDEHRPELTCLRVDTEPAGLAVILGLDPESTVLTDRYDEILGSLVTPDPQVVPASVLGRVDAVDPEALLASSVWKLLRRGRETGAHRGLGLRRLRHKLRRDLGISAPRSRERGAARA